MLNSLRDLTVTLRDMKNYVNEIYTRTYNLEQKLGGAAAPRQTDDGGAVRAYLDAIQTEVRQIRSTQVAHSPGAGSGGAGASCPTCLSTVLFVGVVGAQSVLLLAVIYMRCDFFNFEIVSVRERFRFLRTPPSFLLLLQKQIGEGEILLVGAKNDTDGVCWGHASIRLLLCYALSKRANEWLPSPFLVICCCWL